MRFDAPVFAKAWLAVALASATDKNLVTLHKTVALEVYDTGVRLLATDRFMLLTAWVPDLDTSNDAEPEVDEAPLRTVVAADVDGRGKSLLGYALTLWRRMLDSEGIPPEDATLEVNAEFDQRMPADAAENTFEGMESRYLVLDVPDTERVWLEVVEATYPNWRTLLREHTAETTKVIHLHPERLERLGRLAKYVQGAIEWTFGGAERAALLRAGYLEADGFQVEGVVMPVRWLTEEDPEPADTSGTAADVRGPDVLDCPANACQHRIPVSIEDADGSLSEMVRHAMGHGMTQDEALRGIHGLPPRVPESDVALVKQAAELVITTQFGSPSMLKRKLKVDAEKAGTLMEHLEANGIIGPADGTKPREVLVKPYQLAKALDSLGGAR